MAPLDLPVAEEVTQVAEDGEDAVAHVGEHCHEHGRLLVRLDEGPPVQAAGSDLKEDNRQSEHLQKRNMRPIVCLTKKKKKHIL